MTSVRPASSRHPELAWMAVLPAAVLAGHWLAYTVVPQAWTAGSQASAAAHGYVHAIVPAVVTGAVVALALAARRPGPARRARPSRMIAAQAVAFVVMESAEVLAGGHGVPAAGLVLVGLAAQAFVAAATVWMLGLVGSASARGVDVLGLRRRPPEHAQSRAQRVLTRAGKPSRLHVRQRSPPAFASA